MKKIECCWNIVHYFAWKFDYRMHRSFNKINPMMLIHKLPFQKRMYKRKGIDIYSELDTAYKDPINGISSMRAGSFMFLLGVVIGLDAYLVVQMAIPYYLSPGYIFLFCGPPFIITYFLLFRHEKYLGYFSAFDKMPVEWHKKWKFISCLVTITVFISVPVCFLIMVRMHGGK